MGDELHEFVRAVLHAYVAPGEPNSAQQIARTTLSVLLVKLWATTPQRRTLGDVGACITEAERVGRDADRRFVFQYDPLLVGVKRFDWAALAA